MEMSQAWRWGALEWGPFLLMKGEAGKELALSRVSPRTLNNKGHARCWDEHPKSAPNPPSLSSILATNQVLGTTGLAWRVRA